MKTVKCVECNKESEYLKESRNGLTCYNCRDNFESDYDNRFDPLGLRR